MPTYFHGWRRKLGVVTLVIACVFVAAWVTSLAIPRRFPNPFNFNPQTALEFRDGRIQATAAETKILELPGGRQGLVFINRTVWQLPLAWIAIPLTLLSAYLLLIKPRVAKPKSGPTHV